MKWFKHISDSLDDPDISDAIDLFGSDAYIVFFGILEIMSREFDTQNPGVIEISTAFLKKKLPLSIKKTTEILNFFNERERIYIEFFTGNHMNMVRLNCPKLKELSDNFTSRTLRTKFVPDTNKVSLDKEVEVEVEKETIKDKKKTAKRFIKPTLQQVSSYCKERKNKVDVKRFMNHYDSNGWKVGKNSMKDWKAAVRTWEGNDFNNGNNQEQSSIVLPGRYGEFDNGDVSENKDINSLVKSIGKKV